MSKILFEDPICFFINNDCNLTCKNCATLSNYDYTGHYNFQDYAENYYKWAEIVEFTEIDIAGGEPFLHPDLLTWAGETKRLWPKCNIHVYTNGTLFGLDNNLEIAKEILSLGVGIHISCHSKKHLPLIEKYKKILDSDLVRIEMYDKFFLSYIEKLENNTVHYRYGDREVSHSNCLYSTESYTMNRGLIFKCEMVKTYYNSKNRFNYKDQDRFILDQYKPCSPFENLEIIKNFIKNIGCSIEQCSLCGFENLSLDRKDWIPVTFEKRSKNS